MPTYPACRDVDISCYGNHLTEYVDEIEARISNTIRFCDIVSHRDPGRGQDLTHANPGFCVEHFPAVWVNLQELHSIVNPSALLAHEVTHIELWFAHGHPFLQFVKAPSASDQEMLTAAVNLVSDLAVEPRIAVAGFDRSHDFERDVRKLLDIEEQAIRYVPDYVGPSYGEVWRALHYARLYLNPCCPRRQKRDLKKACKTHHQAWGHLQRLIGMVRDTANIGEPTGQTSLLKRIVDDFDLPQTYVFRTVQGFRPLGSSA